MQKTEHYCDVCGEIAVHLSTKTPVTFTTEQTEGRSINPYLQIESLDLCDQCRHFIVNNQPLKATGAMGHNTYVLQEQIDNA